MLRRAPTTRSPRRTSTPPDRSTATRRATAPWYARAGRRIVRRPVEWARRPWPTSRTVRFAVTAVTLIVTTVVMMNVVHLNPLNMQLGPDLRRQHADRRRHGRPRLGPGVPARQPAAQLAAVGLEHGLVRRHARCTASTWWCRRWRSSPSTRSCPTAWRSSWWPSPGSSTLPLCCWAFGRLARFRYPLPELFAFAGLCFALDESFSIYGGNLKSTMAGEFSFSIALSLMILGFGLLAHSMQTGGRLRNWAAIVLALAVVCHGIVAIYAVVGRADHRARPPRLGAAAACSGRASGSSSCCCRRGGSGRSSATTST